MGAAYDVFGNGKTSLKVNFSKYLQPANNESVFTSPIPAVTFQRRPTRTWTDADGDFVADCDLHELCGQRRVRSVAEPELRQRDSARRRSIRRC